MTGRNPTVHDRVDGDLLEAARRGENEALALLYQRHSDAALRFARSLRGCSAEDAVAEAFTGLISQLRRGTGPAQDARPYIFQAVRNAYVDQVRKHSRYVTFGDHDQLDRPAISAPIADSTEAHDLAGEEFRKLGERERQVLWLTVVEGYSLAEAGTWLGTSEGGAGALAYRARRRLREAIHDKRRSASSGRHLGFRDEAA